MIRFGITDPAGLARPATIFGAPRDVAIPVSFKGFGQAFDALTKE